MNYYDKLKENIEDISIYCDWGNYYKILGLPRGLCLGLAAMWGQAYLAGDTDTYYQRLGLLTRDYASQPFKFNNKEYKNLSELINDISDFEKEIAKLKPVGQANLYTSIAINRKEYELIISIRAFLDGLAAYQEPGNTFLADRHNKVYIQNTLKSSKYVLNKKLTYIERKVFSDQNSQVTYEEVSPLIEIYNYPFVGEEKDYMRFIGPLINKLSECSFYSYVQLGSIDHAIAFNSRKELYDANNLRSGRGIIKAVKSTHIQYLVRMIFKAFSFNARL